ncbi:ABC transporter permease [Bosea sp. 685]|uniref:ABC transporter permease n=1 Tax=Bosea sp. 685 TaxID=3080057 RepID=UPI0028935558|nr:ABC transporter permease [Bosea sp. 685]WNJ88098.1 ABC transporter permease [Bosea sp. 685]
MNEARHPLRLPGTAVLAALAMLFLYVPIIVLVVLSFNASDMTTIWTGFSLHWYAQALGNDTMLVAIGNSLTVAAVATILATAAATSAALGIARSGGRARTAVEGLLGLPLLVPEIVTAVALLMLFVLVGVRLGLMSVILAHTVFCIPFAYYPIRSRLAALDPALGEAASDLYAPAWRRFLRIELPLLAPGIFAGALLAFISSLGDFVITYFVAGPGATTLPVYIYGMIRTGITPEVNALSTLLLLASVAVVAIVFRSGTTPANQTRGEKTS